MNHEQYVRLSVGSVVVERQLGSTPKVIEAFAQGYVLTRPQHGSHPKTRVSLVQLKKRYRPVVA